ncbi:MAG: RNA-binding cell elongation regulator Jag/EloR [Clostridia bacterium]
MSKTIITEGKTTNEAIEKGLKELRVSKDKVEIKVLEQEEKRSFFSILTPRVVKVEMTLKEDIDKKAEVKVKKEVELTEQEIQKAEENLNNFMNELLVQLPENTKFKVYNDKKVIYVEISNSNLGFLIGYRGETLYSLQNILSSIASRGIEKRIRVILDIEGYKAKREKTLEELAEKVAKTVMKTKKPIKLEPMQAYERKIIHSKLQNNNRIKTESVGEEPNRRIIISLKKY